MGGSTVGSNIAFRARQNMQRRIGKRTGEEERVEKWLWVNGWMGDFGAEAGQNQRVAALA